MKTAQLAPSILTADLTNLRAELKSLEEGGADLVHLDIMDGSFVPNITFGQPVVRSIAKATELPLDVHLMIVRPELCLAEFVTERTEYITVHVEACLHLHRTIQQIKSLGVKAGISLNPATPLSELEYVIDEIDLVLLMSVNPGFGGQKFIESTWEKLRALDRMRNEKNPGLMLQIDGGVNLDNAAQLIADGADILVAGSAVFSGEDAAENVRKFKQILQRAGS